MLVFSQLTFCLRSLFTLCLVLITLNVSSQCNVKYVSPGATGTGAIDDPGDLELIVAGAVAEDVIRLDTGEYIISNAINVPSSITIEGGFIQALDWTKTSLAGATRIVRDNTNPEGAIGFDRIVAMYANGSTNFSIRDLSIETENATGNSRSNYGVHLTDCSDYTFSRTIIVAGAGSDGVDGIGGANGANGQNGFNGLDGDNDSEADPGHGGRGGNGGGVGSGLGGNGGIDGGGCCFVGPPGVVGGISLNSRAGGGGGGGGCGGEEDSDGGNGGGRGGVFLTYGSGGPVGIGGNSNGCSGGDNGTFGSVGLNGVNGINGANALTGTFVGGFFTPGNGTDGTDGTGGTGGSGGGGGGGQGGAFCYDGAGNGGGGGGGGGQGGELGTGGTGGGGSFSVYLYNNGVNGRFVQCDLEVAPAASGGVGGSGGIGGNWGLGGLGGDFFLSEIGRGGNGGRGGRGGLGGDGGNGAAGSAIELYQDGGTAPVLSDIAFDLASQPEIRFTNDICVYDTVQFSADYSGDWDFGVDAIPPTGTGIMLNTHFQDTGRFDIGFDGHVYSEFTYITPYSTDSAKAGDDLIYCEGDPGIALNAENPAWGSGAWTSLGAAVVDSPTLFNSTVSGATIGDNLFVWTVSSDCCQDRTDTMIVSIIPHSSNTFDVTECGSYLVPSGDETYTTPGSYVVMDTIPNVAGCDSVLTINLTIIEEDATIETITACDTYTWIDGITYTSDEFAATHALTNAAGCDSVITLNLTIENSNSGTDVISACETYTWIDGITYTSDEFAATHTLTNVAGCDSVVTLNLTIHTSDAETDVITACDSYTWIDGITYTSDEYAATHSLTNIHGCDSIVTLNLTIENSSAGTDIITACDSYTWIDGITYTSDEFAATHTLTNAVGCDSVVTLNLTIENSTVGTDVITACDSYTWIDGITYTSDEFAATHTLTNAVGCDSVVTLNLTVENSTVGTDIITACDSYTWIDGITYTSDEFAATHTLTNVAGCDSVVTLNLTINNSSVGTDVITACDSYTWLDGITYIADEFTATHTLTNAVGCDSVVTLNLTINNSNAGTDVITACESYTWINGITYTSDEFAATHTLTNIDGCDSVVTLNLSISYDNAGTDVITACDSYTWIDGITYTSDEFAATHTLTNIAGCDSVVTLNLTVEYSSSGIDVITACDSYTWIDGVTYTSDEFAATHTLTNAVGCDSVVTLNLTINNSSIGTDVITACDSYTWIDGVTYTSDEFTATHVLTNALGCDSIVTLNLTIYNSTASVDEIEACNSYTWINGITYTSDEFTATHTLTTVEGCDSVVTLNLTIHPLPDVGIDASSIEVCFGETITLAGTGASTYTWDGGIINGIPFAPGTIGTTLYTVIGVSAEGCESTASIEIDVTDCDPVYPEFEIVGAPCVGNCIQINDLSTGGPITDWSWDFGGAVTPGTSTEQNPIICLDAIGTFTIELTTTNINGSTYTTEEILNVYPTPTIETDLDTIIEVGGSADLIAIASWDGEYIWTPDNNVACVDCAITTANPIEDQVYTVQFSDVNGCKVADTVMVLVNFKEGIGVPTAFSPNGDGNNDVLFVKGFGIESMHFSIYNRYGEMIFETSDQRFGWDGTYLGRDENPGVFTWVLRYDLINGRSGKQQGNTTLIR